MNFLLCKQQDSGAPHSQDLLVRWVRFLLLILSVIIYVSYGLSNFIYICFSLLTTFVAARNLKQDDKNRKIVLVGTIIINTIILVGVKFLPYTSLNILAPLGVSYYTLQVISYLVDVYKGKYEYEKNLFNYALYIMYIPHLFIGPISRYDEMKKQIITNGKITVSNLYNGGIRILWGLSKKLIIAGRIAIVIETITNNGYSGTYSLLAMLLYSIELYSDFSGGIDIVLGISKMLGIDLIENFDAPYYSQNIKEFWRRWHISLSSWLRDYIYIPLGGSRCSKIRKAINVLITFAVSGLWHGANYILWGILHGIFVLMGDKYNTKSKWFNRFVNFIIVSFLWSFFIWNGNAEAIKMMASIFTNFNITEVWSNTLNLGLTIADWIVLFASTIILFIYDGNKNKILQRTKKISNPTKLAIICTLGLIVLTFGIYGIGFNVNEFIYSRF